ncbi:Ig-like domain-containing protein [Klebsiella pneumoniae]|uniref:Ig-like domain-containing protein n=1 Tax=Klebsiella pneumoniae TaxID=573 RepID=UPI002265AA4C|nr:Ig-like domain-containing protein [Klebsiella pneumoniae]
MTLTATLTPADSTDTVQWTSSDPTIASVVSTGQKNSNSHQKCCWYCNHHR